MRIKKGDRVRITVQGGRGVYGAGWGEGIVLSAANNEWNPDKPANWYIELDKDKCGGRNWETGYGYWKQGCDGGTVELLKTAEELEEEGQAA